MRVDEIWAGVSPEALRAGLIAIAQDLRSGKLVHVTETQDLSFAEWFKVWASDDKQFFNMATAISSVKQEDSHCGTAACIGGWFGLKAGWNTETVANAVSHPPEALYELFMPGMLQDRWSDLTAKQAAAAIDEWLAGNHSRPWVGAEHGEGEDHDDED